jgi:hypothetical protein
MKYKSLTLVVAIALAFSKAAQRIANHAHTVACNADESALIKVYSEAERLEDDADEMLDRAYGTLAYCKRAVVIATEKADAMRIAANNKHTLASEFDLTYNGY